MRKRCVVALRHGDLHPQRTVPPAWNRRLRKALHRPVHVQRARRRWMPSSPSSQHVIADRRRTRLDAATVTVQLADQRVIHIAEVNGQLFRGRLRTQVAASASVSAAKPEMSANNAAPLGAIKERQALCQGLSAIHRNVEKASRARAEPDPERSGFGRRKPRKRSAITCIHFEREVGSLLHQEHEAPAIHLSHAAIGVGDGRAAARPIINQGHLPGDLAGVQAC